MASDEVQTLIVMGSMLVGGIFGFMFGIMYALRRILELRHDVEKAEGERRKLLEMMHTQAVEAAESAADEPEERPAGPTPKKRTEAIQDDASASRDTEGRDRAREDDPVPVRADDQRRDET